MRLAEAFEHQQGQRSAPAFLTCEHASERLPAPWRWPGEDARLWGTHWAFDLGARELTLELAAALGASAVLARFSRLLVDPNRPLLHRDLFRAVADGQGVGLNAALSAQERVLRIERYYRAYHFAVDQGLAQSRAPILLSLHSFTPLYEGRARSVALGVLFNRHEAAARALGAHLAREFSGVAYNEPWSGKEGLMYAAEAHAERHGRVPIELEVRQDLAVDAGYRARLVSALVRYFSSSRPSSSAKLQGR